MRYCRLRNEEGGGLVPVMQEKFEEATKGKYPYYQEISSAGSSAGSAKAGSTKSKGSPDLRTCSKSPQQHTNKI